MTITLETAERLDRQLPRPTRRPRTSSTTSTSSWSRSNNPDGANYSLLQLRLAAPEHDEPLPGRQRRSGPPRRWGVDLNRNYRVGSGFDGYDGASTSCISDTFQGPAELSEPESKNAIWLVENYRNIKFMMSVHSNGGQLFWQPGAYIADGRITTPRPPLGHEAFYWQSADRILSQVRAHRQTVVTPENVGGSSDVLYSSAGNVREDLYFNYGIYAFGWEVGGSVYNPATGNFQGGSFQPPWVGAPTWSAATARRWSTPTASWRCSGSPATSARTRRRRRRRSSPGRHQSDSPIGVRFEITEPATIYYTTDGTRADAPVAALQADRVPRAGRDPVGRADDDVQVVLGRRRQRRDNYDPATWRRRTTTAATIQIGENVHVGRHGAGDAGTDARRARRSFGAFTPGVGARLQGVDDRRT